MALFTDGAVANIEELRGHDTQLLDVATVEGIDVTRKLALAQEELSVELAGLTRGLGSSVAIHQVVVTPPLKLWYIFRTLEMVYRDAYNSQLNDRYAGKRDEYQGMVKWARDQVLRGGLGIVTDPVERAAMPVVEPAAGGLADGLYYVAITWINGTGEEGDVSAAATIQVSGRSFAVETNAPANVKGWNVYVGTSPATTNLQNEVTLAPVETFVQPDILLTAGRTAGNGQSPNYLLAVPRTIQRG